MKKAFTLVELLIVIAIIALLAAIAIPNFLEAQTRSKVSSAHSDMRTFSVGLNAYYVDEHRFPPQDNLVSPVARRAGLERLTSPVAYLTSINRDVFALDQGPLSNYYYVNIEKNESIGGIARVNNRYILGSVGPDSQDNLPDVIRDITDNRFYQINESGIYDPTNGTISHGDLIRTNNSALGGIEAARW